MKSLLNWLAAAASLIGLFFTLRPASGELTHWQISFVLLVIVVFGVVAIRDISEEQKRAAKTYKDNNEINNYMFDMLRDIGRCEICSRDASWINDKRIFNLLKDKAKRKELTFLIHQSTPDLEILKKMGA